MGQLLSHKRSAKWMKFLHIEFGRHSLIPECCIEFWLEFCYKAPLPAPYLAAYGEWIEICNWGYIPCPFCVIRNNKVKIHICGKECEGIWYIGGKSLIYWAKKGHEVNMKHGINLSPLRSKNRHVRESSAVER